MRCVPHTNLRSFVGLATLWDRNWQSRKGRINKTNKNSVAVGDDTKRKKDGFEYIDFICEF